MPTCPVRRTPGGQPAWHPRGVMSPVTSRPWRLRPPLRPRRAAAPESAQIPSSGILFDIGQSTALEYRTEFPGSVSLVLRERLLPAPRGAGRRPACGGADVAGRAPAVTRHLGLRHRAPTTPDDTEPGLFPRHSIRPAPRSAHLADVFSEFNSRPERQLRRSRRRWPARFRAPIAAGVS